MTIQQDIITNAVGRGASATPDSGLLWSVNNVTAAVGIPDLSTEPAMRAIARAVSEVSTFAEAATKAHADPRLSGAGKAQDLTTLAGRADEVFMALAIANAEEQVAADRAAAVETGANKIPPNDHAEIALDAERRAILRSMGLPEGLREVTVDRLCADAVLRLPLGFEAPLVEVARRAVRESDPEAFPLHRTAADWRLAAECVSQCRVAVARLSAGLGGTIAVAA